jgi:hypothetical protein
MLVDTGGAVNIMPYSVLRKLRHSVGDLIKTNITLSDFNGQTSEVQGVLNVDLTVEVKPSLRHFLWSIAKAHTPFYLGEIGSMSIAVSLLQCTSV